MDSYNNTKEEKLGMDIVITGYDKTVLIRYHI